MTTEDDGALRHDLYVTSFKILEHEVVKMKDLMRFSDHASQLMVGIFTSLSLDHEEYFLTGDLLLMLARMFDFFMMMDAIKNSKPSLNNDFSMFKR